MTRIDIIQQFIDINNYETYLEIGLDYGVTFEAIQINLTESVDPAQGQYQHATPTYQMTSDEFFDRFPHKKYDIIFIDGLHEHQQVLRDIHNSIKSLNPNGTIVVHDCNPTEEIYQRVPRESKFWNGDVWKAFVEFRSIFSKQYTTYVVDADCGCGVIKKGGSEVDIKLPQELTYDWLDENRTKALGLISTDEFKERVLI